MQRVLEDLSLSVGCLVVPGEWLHVSKGEGGRAGVRVVTCSFWKLSSCGRHRKGPRIAQRGVTSSPILIQTRAARSRVLCGSALIVWVYPQRITIESSQPLSQALSKQRGPRCPPDFMIVLIKHLLIDGMHYVGSRLKMTNRTFPPVRRQGRVSAGLHPDLLS